MQKRRGFTLVELLVVIAIIALLLTFILPALNKAKEHTKHVVCMANMRALITGWIDYANDNDDYIMESMTYDSPDAPCWVKIPASYWLPMGQITDEMRKETIERGVLWPYVQSYEAYHCPADPTPHWRSYSIQNSLYGEQWGVDQSGSPMVKKSSNVHEPSAKYVFLGESDYREYNMNSWIVYCYDDSGNVIEQFMDPVTAWHVDSTSFAFADGRVESRRWVDERTIYIANEQVIGYPTPNNPDLEWLQYGFYAARK